MRLWVDWAYSFALHRYRRVLPVYCYLHALNKDAVYLFNY